MGFEMIYQLMQGRLALLLRQLGLQIHYESISRGVVDTRDVVYFLSVVAFFLMATRLVLQSRKWKR